MISCVIFTILLVLHVPAESTASVLEVSEPDKAEESLMRYDLYFVLCFHVIRFY